MTWQQRRSGADYYVLRVSHYNGEGPPLRISFWVVPWTAMAEKAPLNLSQNGWRIVSQHRTKLNAMKAADSWYKKARKLHTECKLIEWQVLNDDWMVEA